MALRLEEIPLTRDGIINTLSYISQEVGKEDPMLSGLSQRRILGNFYAFSQLALQLMEGKELSQEETRHLLRDACYGLDEESRRELRTD